MELSNSDRKKRFGKILFGAFLICTLYIVLSIAFDKNIRVLFSNSGYSQYGKFMSNIVFIDILALFILCFWIKRRTFRIISLSVLGLVLILLFLAIFIFRPHKINGNSMTPYLENKDYVLGSALLYRLGEPQRGDIVIFRSPDTGSDSVDRIIGLPGENISIEDRQVYINGKKLDERYLSSSSKTNSGQFITENNSLIPANQYAVLGDNRYRSNDSRAYGFVNKRDINEKVFYIYWPSSRSGFLKSDK